MLKVLRNSETLRIRKWMVAIISVMLILVTTISYIALPPAFAVGEEQAQEQAAPAEGEQPAPAEGEAQPAAEGEAPAEGEQPAGGEAPAEGEAAPAEGEAAPAAEDGTATVSLPAISASSYIVMSGSTSERVVEKHSERKMQPGKITLLMTAMVVLDNMYDDRELKNTVDINSDLAKYGTTFAEGESVSVGDLLDAMLVSGDAQAAEALAAYSASSREIFINEMNSKSMALDIMDTQFVNPSGEKETTQYSTAADLAVITQAAMRYRRIRDTLALTSAKLTPTVNKEPREMEVFSTDPLLAGEQAYEHIEGGILGVSEGDKNNTQFAAVSVKDDMQLIVILMDSDADKAAGEAAALLEYGDSKVTRNTIVKKGKLSGHARVRGGARTRVPAYTESKGFAYVPPEGSDSLIQTQVVMDSDLEAPLSKGDKVGEFRIYVADELKGTVDLIIKQNVPVGWAPSKYYISNRAAVVLGILIVLLIAFFARVVHVKRRREKRREAIRRAKIREMARRQLEIDEDRRRREWTASGYEDLPPRTTDIRRDSIETERSGNSRRRGPGRKR